jgi:hypothetical protein
MLHRLLVMRPIPPTFVRGGDFFGGLNPDELLCGVPDILALLPEEFRVIVPVEDGDADESAFLIMLPPEPTVAAVLSEPLSPRLKMVPLPSFVFGGATFVSAGVL